MTKLTDEERKERNRIRNKKFREENPTYWTDYYHRMKNDPHFQAQLAKYNHSSYKARKARMTPEEIDADRQRNTDHCREWRENNRDKARAYMNEYMKDYWKRNPEKMAIRNEQARARYYTKRGLPVPPKKVPKKDG